MSGDLVDALMEVGERLAGFDARCSFEWLDGALTALVTGPRAPPFEEWTETLLGDAYARAYADPEAVAQARRVLEARLAELHRQLYSEALVDAPDQLRLAPLLYDFDAADGSDDPLPGGLWASGFLDAVQAWSAEWDGIGGEALPLLECIGALTLPPDELAAYLANAYPRQTLERDDLIDEACYAVQELRVLCAEALPAVAPRRVEKLPGRNDPCPCGSGRKFKKCHGA